MKVFQLNDCDWYMGHTLGEAIKAAIDDCGVPVEELVDDGHELTDDELDNLKYQDGEYGGTGEVRTFREELARRVATGKAKAEMFASTEY